MTLDVPNLAVPPERGQLTPFLAGFGVAVSLAVFVNAVSKMRRPASMITFQDLATHWFREGAAQNDRSFRQGLAKAASDLRHVINTGRLAE